MNVNVYPLSHISMYTLYRNKVTFNLSICLGALGSLTLSDGLDDSVKIDQGSLTLTSDHQEKTMKIM